MAEQLHQIGFKSAQIVLEPCGRNTAPALALAALVAQQQNDDAEMLVMPADHVIKDEQAFADAVTKAVRLPTTAS